MHWRSAGGRGRAAIDFSPLERPPSRSGRAGECLAHSAAMDTAAPRLNLKAYRRLLRNQLVPTRMQRESFPFFVAKAHSWYKRIPPLSPGEPFVFFLDPAAGFDRVPQPAGSWTTSVREQQGFHHAAIPTWQYRDRFGNLAFACAQSMRTGTFASGPLRIQTGFGACLIDEVGALRRLPVEVEAGAVRLTSVIHPYFNQPFGWSLLGERRAVAGIWPEESGGDAAFARIQARCRELRADRSKLVRLRFPDDHRGVDAVFAELVEPERQRQRRLVVGAVERLLALLDQKPG